MRLRQITLEMVQATVDAPDRVTTGIYADLYDKMVDGHLLRVVLAKNTEPAIVKTVMWRPDRVVESPMHLDYDREADALYITFREETQGQVVTHELDERRFIDRDDLGDVGVEILDVSLGVDLTGLPRRDEIAALLNAIPHPV